MVHSSEATPWLKCFLGKNEALIFLIFFIIKTRISAVKATSQPDVIYSRVDAEGFGWEFCTGHARPRPRDGVSAWVVIGRAEEDNRQRFEAIWRLPFAYQVHNHHKPEAANSLDAAKLDHYAGYEQKR